MIEKEIIEKLKSLRSIAPSEDFSSVSKSIIGSETFEKIDRSLVSRLALLKNLKPDPNYALESKLSILESKLLKTPIRLSQILSPKNVLRQMTNYGLSVAFAVLLVAVLVGGASRFIIGGGDIAVIENKSLLAEADKISTDIGARLKEVEYYKTAAQKTTIALNEASTNGPGHLNSVLIEKEASSLEATDPRNKDIENLLNKAMF